MWKELNLSYDPLFLKSLDPAMKTMNYELIKAEQKIGVLVLYKWVPNFTGISILGLPCL